MKVEVLLYIVRSNSVLLIMKKRGLGAGLYNGIGGKVEDDETPEMAAVREAVEEVGVVPRGLRWAGLLEFTNFGDSSIELHYVHVFLASDFSGEPTESEEARPTWFPVSSIPYHMMWPDDRMWLPHVLEGKKVLGRFLFHRWELKSGQVFLLEEARQPFLDGG